MAFHAESINALNHVREKAKNKRIIFVSGNFNIIHPGHLRLLRFAKECGDYLVVGVLDGRSDEAVIQATLRLEGIQAISWVDYGFILHDSPVSFIEELRPVFVVKGKEHEDRYNPEADVLAKVGGKILFSSGDISFSSIDLMKREWNELNLSTIKKPVDFMKRHKFDFKKLFDIFLDMKNLRVCVIGDVIVDEYITCDALGMSQEDPTIVVTPIVQEKFVGGAGIVAAHAYGLGASVNFFSIAGMDEIGIFARDNLKGYGVNVHFYEDESRPTTLKQRYRAGQKTLLRVSHLRQHAINAEIRKKMFQDICDIISETDILIFADFNYGCLPQSLVDIIVDECGRQGVIMVADSQSSSQIGDVSRFKGMALITPTEKEARFAVHDFESGLVVLAEKLRQKALTKNVVITLAEEGVLIHAETDVNDEWLTDRLPAFNVAPKDVSGAGDSFLTCASMALAVGADIWQGSYMGSLAAACQVGSLGNTPLTLAELISEINA
ncbi:MAG: ADP-heptose synthase [Nitrospirae bacterium GWF2_44_13]|nr:MAG: ADP-heptose synthase [Nitrospirae bacterium GWF2_44_13]OGW63509.1 MAG: ADP-heptose synthase [Nitrospirae bacterium RIFOXYA2_FULL_44_9]